MKKKHINNRIWVLMVSVLFLFLCTGCLNQNEKTESPEKEKEKIAGIEYRNETYGFTLDMPQSWDGLYAVRESKGEDGIAHVYVCNKSQLESEKQFITGILFTISIYPSEESYEKDGQPLEDIINLQRMAVDGNNVFAYHFPTDVQYNPGNTKVAKEYRAMFNDAREVIHSFQLK